MGWLPPRINDVETGRTPQYPDVQPLHVPLSPDQVFLAVSAVAGRMRRWTVVRVDPGKRLLQAEARTRLVRFVDDVTIRVEAEAGGASVRMRSRSRVGISDLGVNAARIRSFLRRVAGELKAGGNGAVR